MSDINKQTKTKEDTPELVAKDGTEFGATEPVEVKSTEAPDNSEALDTTAALSTSGEKAKTALVPTNLNDSLYDEDPSNMVRQAKKTLPSAALVSIAELFDVGVIGMFGAIVVSFSVAAIGIFIPGLHGDFHSIVACALASGVFGFTVYMLSALVPIFFPSAMLALQVGSGSYVGPIVVNAVCSYLGADPATAPLATTLISTWLTVVLSILPIFACPLYFAVTLSSKWQTSLGWSLVGLMVCDENGLRPSFAKAWKRTILRLWWPIMFPAKLAYSGLIDDWVEEHSKTVLLLKPQHLKAEMLKAKDQVLKSDNKITIKAYNSVIGAGTKQLLGQRMQGAALSPQAVKRMLKPNLSAMILRAEGYFVMMLGMLFLARTNAAYWTYLYFNGFKANDISGSFASFVDEHPWIPAMFPITLAVLYVFALIVSRRSTPQIFELSSKGFLVTKTSRPLLGFLNKGQIGQKTNRWEDVTAIHLEPGNGKDPEEKWLVFAMRNREPVRVRLDIIRSISSKEEILRAIERWAPDAEKDTDLITTLQPPSDYSYTDIWLEALTGPPKRDKLKPLISGALLKDNQYRVTNVIAVGGQGSVYLAKDCVSGEDAVLKEFVLPVYVDLSVRRKAIERFEKEARLLSQLQHANIVKLLDYFVEDYRAYMVLEHLNGTNLHNVVKERGKLSNEEVISLALQMCDMLKYLHEQSPPVVHRDFTPENLILGTDGILKLIDFNVAQTLDQSATTTGTVVGKPSYLAPEQFRGEPTAASDVYSFGATLAYLLTGEDPTPISQSHPAQSTPSVSAELDLIVSQCTSYDSELRFKTIQDIENALRSC
ncbi:MAG TPA: protein kinase [Drouetiella sp.]